MKMKKWIILCLVIVVLVIGAVLGYNAWYQNSHVFVADQAYDKELEFLDLRGTGTSVEDYESLRQQLPGCEIRYDLPFQGSFYPDDTRKLTVSSLTDEEVELLDYLPCWKPWMPPAARIMNSLWNLAGGIPAVNCCIP